MNQGLTPDYVLWLAGFVGISWLGGRRLQHVMMPIVGIIWLSVVQFQACLAILALTAVLLIAQKQSSKRVLTLAAIGLLAAAGLGYRYLELYPFLSHLPIPGMIGLAFAFLKAIHYLADYRSQRLPPHRAIDVLGYMFYFPTLMVGPIMRYGDWHREARLRRWDANDLSLGMERVLIGYVKVIVIAGYLITQKLDVVLADAFAIDTPLGVYLHCLQYGLQLYLMFSGYSDIAIGMARMTGVRVAENFHYPFLATSIIEFWNRWHITLSRWCRDYIFIPLAARFHRPAMAVICSMLVLGIWHELSLRYVLWGLYHATGIAIAQKWRHWSRADIKWLPRIPDVLRTAAAWGLTFNFVILGFLFTSRPTAADAFRSFLVMVGMQ